MSFTLPELPFAKDALGTFMSPEGFEYHHGKHHNAYVTKLNGAAEGNDYATMKLEDAIVKSEGERNLAIYNNAAQHWNHSFFWNCMSPKGGGAATGKVAELINRDFGSFDKFKKEFSDKAATLFGSGWAWLVVGENGKLEIMQLSNAGTPMVHGKKAILTIDVWEHAYYIDHRNARPNFIAEFWNYINWDFVNSNL